MKDLLLNLDRINKDRINYCIKIIQVIDCGFMCIVTYAITGRIYRKDLYNNKPYATNIDMLLYELRRGGVKV